jgi:4-oxalocrotonate tautomerase
MPIVRIELWEGRDDGVKENLIKNVTEAVADSLEIPAEHVRVILHDVPRKHWGIGGVPASKMDFEY